METAAHSALYDAEPSRELPGSPAAPAQTLAVTATYLLSEAGRKASLLAGGSGRAVQHAEIQVAANRLHLVTVNDKGVARLKLLPRFEFNSQQRLVLIDAPATFDSPPTADDLLRAAARNHQLERAYYAERTTAAAKRSEADHARRAEIAQAFLRDATQRALIHPPPSPKRCFVATPHGRIRFEADRDDAPARDVPREALRRFRADVKAARERRERERSGHLKVHEERKQALAEWVALHGTPEQQARYAAGVLPAQEVIEALADEAFRPLVQLTPYVRDGVARLQEHLRQFPAYAEVVVTPLDFAISSRTLPTATSAQWTFLEDFRAAMPDARRVLRERMLAWKGDAKAPRLRIVTMVVLKRLGPFMLRREFLLPDTVQRAPVSSEGSES